MPSELEERLLRAGADLPEPPGEAAARIRSVVVDSARGGPHTRSRLRRVARAIRRPAGIAATAGTFGGIAVLFGLLIIAAPEREETAPSSLRPDVSSLTRVRLCSEPRLRAPCVAGTPRVRAATPALHDAPWLYGTPVRRLGSEAPRPSLIFPAGTTYVEAVDALYVSAVLTGGLPQGTRLGPPLPPGAVLLRPADPAEGIALDLRAPLGYKPPQGTIYSYVYVGTPTGQSRGRLWLPGMRIAVPTLPKCMIVTSRRSVPPRCGPREEPTLRGLRGEPLPEIGVSAGLIAPDRRVPAATISGSVLRAADGVGPAGSRASLADLRGRVVVAGFMASWCEPCQKHARGLDATARDWRAEDVTVLGIAVSDPRSSALSFLGGWTFPSLYDPQGDALVALDAARAASSVLPRTFLIDKQGRVALTFGGRPSWDRLDRGIAELVSETP